MEFGYHQEDLPRERTYRDMWRERVKRIGDEPEVLSHLDICLLLTETLDMFCCTIHRTSDISIDELTRKNKLMSPNNHGRQNENNFPFSQGLNEEFNSIFPVSH